MQVLDVACMLGFGTCSPSSSTRLPSSAILCIISQMSMGVYPKGNSHFFLLLSELCTSHHFSVFQQVGR